MKINLVYMSDTGLENFEVTNSESNGLHHFVIKKQLTKYTRELVGEDNGVRPADAALTIENPVFHDNFPNMIVTVLMSNCQEIIDFSRIRILELDYPEQKLFFNPQTNQVEERESQVEKELKAKLGGADAK